MLVRSWIVFLGESSRFQNFSIKQCSKRVYQTMHTHLVRAPIHIAWMKWTKPQLIHEPSGYSLHRICAQYKYGLLSELLYPKTNIFFHHTAIIAGIVMKSKLDSWCCDEANKRMLSDWDIGGTTWRMNLFLAYQHGSQAWFDQSGGQGLAQSTQSEIVLFVYFAIMGMFHRPLN